MKVSYSLFDNIKDSQIYKDSHDACNMEKSFLQVDILRQWRKKEIRIICYINSGSKYIRKYRHSESKLFNVSYLPPDNIHWD